jgi:hypothetical protein
VEVGFSPKLRLKSLISLTPRRLALVMGVNSWQLTISEGDFHAAAAPEVFLSCSFDV